MINLAPIAAAPQPASQSPVPAGNGTGSESTFESIFDRSVAARRRSAPQNTSDKSAPPRRTTQAHGTSQAEADAQITKAETTENGALTAPADGTVAGGPDAGTPSQTAPTPGEAEHEPRDGVSPRSVLTDGMTGNGATVYLLNNLNAIIDPANIAIETSARNGALVSRPEGAASRIMLQDKAAVISGSEMAETQIIPGKAAAVGKAEIAASPVMPGKEAVVGKADVVTATPVMPDNTTPVPNATAQITIRTATLTPTAENPSAQAALSGSITPATDSDQPAPPAASQHLSAQLLDLMNSKEPGAAPNTAGPTTGAGLQVPDNVVSGLRISQLSTAPAAQGQQKPTPSDTSPLMAGLTQLTSLKEPVSEAPGKPSSSPVHPSDRHAIREQLLETKIDTQRSADDGKQQQQQQQQQQSQQPAKQEIAASPQPFGNQTSTSPTADQSMTFSQVSQGVMSQQPVQTAPVTTHQSAMPPASAPIYEESVFNQVAERLQMQLNNRETQLNIKLHPEELGRLDIRLTVKEGSIRAHVVAQSGQVQELLEKNMTRLKALLEGQGFTIEELRVSNRSENIGNSDLFQDQLAGGKTATAHGSHKTDTSFGETFESVVTTFGSRTTGVNITA